MTRSEAKILAEELYKLMKKDIKNLVSQAVEKETDEWLTAEQVADMIGVSISYVMHSDIPHSKIGRLNRYRKSDIVKLIER